MRKYLVCLVAIMAHVVTAAQVPSFGPNDALAFDYLNADFSTYQVTGFEHPWDSGGWTMVTATAFQDAGTSAGATSYKVVPPFTTGQHTVSFRACNVVGCGGGSTPFSFMYSSTPSNAPTNVRKVPR